MRFRPSTRRSRGSSTCIADRIKWALMGPLTRNGKLAVLLFAILSFSVSATYAQSSAAIQCSVTSSPAQLRAEGVTELLGDILLQCSGSTPGTAITGNLTIGL